MAIWIRKVTAKESKTKELFFAPPFNDKWQLFVQSRRGKENLIRFLRGFISRSRSINLNGYRSRGRGDEKEAMREGEEDFDSWIGEGTKLGKCHIIPCKVTLLVSNSICDTCHYWSKSSVTFRWHTSEKPRIQNYCGLPT